MSNSIWVLGTRAMSRLLNRPRTNRFLISFARSTRALPGRISPSPTSSAEDREKRDILMRGNISVALVPMEL